MSRSQNPVRDAEIVRRAKAGETFAAIGADYGISREWVRQIVLRRGLTAEDFAVERHEARKVEWACEACGKRERRTPWRSKVNRFCSLACSQPVVRGTWVRVSDGDLLDLLTDLALELGQTPGNNDVNADPDMPSHAEYHRRFGSLTRAQELAGLTPNERGKPPKPLPAAMRNGGAA